jgi:hypothetical protein
LNKKNVIGTTMLMVPLYKDTVTLEWV